MERLIGKTKINEMRNDYQKIRSTLLRLCLNSCLRWDKVDKLVEENIIMDLDDALDLIAGREDKAKELYERKLRLFAKTGDEKYLEAVSVLEEIIGIGSKETDEKLKEILDSMD